MHTVNILGTSEPNFGSLVTWVLDPAARKSWTHFNCGSSGRNSKPKAWPWPAVSSLCVYSVTDSVLQHTLCQIQPFVFQIKLGESFSYLVLQQGSFHWGIETGSRKVHKLKIKKQFGFSLSVKRQISIHVCLFIELTYMYYADVGFQYLPHQLEYWRVSSLKNVPKSIYVLW